MSLYTHVTANLSERTLVNLSRRHASIYKALEEGDSEGARHVMHQHLSELRDEILAKMEAEGTYKSRGDERVGELYSIAKQ